ncbi:MAG TPA: hypothetical protein VEJ42_10095 [Streptosporangiaceae bacterium]|nr:hypothetical protein [Streptosporangiaceae bacterium]
MVGDADFGDEGFDGGFAFGGGAAGDGVGEVGLEVFDDAGWWRCGLVAECLGEFVGAGGELGDLVVQGLEPLAGGGVVHGAVLEGSVVAVDRGLLLLDLGEDRGVLGALAGVPVAVTLLCLGDGVVDEAGGVGVEVAQCLEDGGVGFVGGQPRGRAAVGAVAGAGEAGVVAVGAGPAGGGGANVAVPAVRAGDQPGEVVVGGACGALGVLAGAGGGDRQGHLPHLAADQRLVGVLDVHLAVAEVACVGGVGDDPGDGVSGPGHAGPVGYSAPVQHAGDRAGAEAFVGVEPEDLPQVRRFVGVRNQFLCLPVDVVPVGPVAAGPLALGGLGVHALGDAVDDGFPLELGEHPQQLDEHPADRGGGVERLGRRGERHPGLIEFGEKAEQVGQAAGEPVDPVDQQHVKQPGAGGAQRLVQTGPAGGGARGVAVGSGEGPAWLGGDIGGEGGFLRADGEGLVLVVGGAAQVDRNPARPGGCAAEAGNGTPAFAAACGWRRAGGCHRRGPPGGGQGLVAGRVRPPRLPRGVRRAGRSARRRLARVLVLGCAHRRATDPGHPGPRGRR